MVAARQLAAGWKELLDGVPMVPRISTLSYCTPFLVCLIFGQSIFAHIPDEPVHRAKLSNRWIQGVWLGREIPFY